MQTNRVVRDLQALEQMIESIPEESLPPALRLALRLRKGAKKRSVDLKKASDWASVILEGLAFAESGQNCKLTVNINGKRGIASIETERPRVSRAELDRRHGLESRF